LIFRSIHFLLVTTIVVAGCSSSVTSTVEPDLPGALPPTLPAAGSTADPHTPPVAPQRAPFGPSVTFTRVTSRRFGISIPLPDRPGWKLMKQPRSRFLELRHERTQSQLVIRSWHEDDRMNRARCESRARVWRPLAQRGRGISERFIDLPKGYDTRVDTGFTFEAGVPTGGYVIAFGARARKCFAFVYTTRTSGPDAEAQISERLAVMQTGVLEHIERRGLLP
jgi:hypothetical protein